ncbi:MAG: XRE family transcriptional regulator [Candidatus Portnoybacteria bacterium CG_4_10_14_0_8_um_filter_40_50]|uniref:XRE family transcriptional regulator n=1 Tax=Candidatus Portnoybacteria bacterium CG_4_10_14_0_8_um_filter_40_50 TaxID=1974800 RepID=A0A2M7QS28_9BACT|nr:MAG: XRE family transcriptional regulator [Candidatus Portnoybacteria bacterium CG_4_10_14_0_8_um_filter_40_50]
MLSKFIHQLRKKNNLTQEFLALELGISRPTYVQIEQGKRDLTITEAQKLAGIFSMSLEDLLSGNKKEVEIDFEEGKSKKTAEPEMRIVMPRANVKKFKEVLLYLLEKVGARPNIGETAIYKLLYFIDFDYYEKFEEQLTGARYIKNHFGPTPIEFKKITDQMMEKGEIERIKSRYFQHDQRKYLPRRAADLKILSAQEIQHIDEVLARLAWKNAAELSNYSHSDTPWRVHKMGEEISYETVFYRDEDHSVRNYEDEL